MREIISIAMLATAVSIGGTMAAYASTATPADAEEIVESDSSAVDEDEVFTGSNQTESGTESTTDKASESDAPSDTAYKIQEIIDSMTRTVTIREINSELDAIEYVSQYFTNEINEEYGLNITVDYRSSGSYVRVYIDYADENGDQQIWTGIQIELDDEAVETVDSVTNKCESIISSLESTGIPMSKANTQAEIYNYITNLLPDNNNIDYSLVIYANDYESAIAGTNSNKYGTEGQVYIYLRIAYKDYFFDAGKIHSGRIAIIPTVYSGSSSDSDDGGSGNTQYAEGMTITKESVYGGTWEKYLESWRLRLEDNTLATSRWGKIDDHWYIFNEHGNMLTGWRQINGKWYYFDLESGAMLADTTTPDGYRVNASGEWEK